MVKNNIQAKKLKQSALNALSTICGVVISGVSIEESLGRIAFITSEMMNAKACSVMLYDRENQELSVKACLGAVPGLNNKISVKLGISIPGKAVIEKKIVTSMPEAKKGKPILPGTREFGDISSMISAPLMYKNEPIGVINTYVNKTHVFTDDEKRIMQAIADQSSAAIQMHKFKEEAITAKEALKDRKIIDKAKGILMKQNHMNEDQAYKAMRQKSMDTSKPMKFIAEAIIMTNEMRG